MQSIRQLSTSQRIQPTTIRRRKRRSSAKTREWIRIVACRSSKESTRLNPAVGQLRPSKTVALADLAKKMKEQGKDVVSLAVGEPDFPTPQPICNAAIEAIREGFTKYTMNSGMSLLRQLIRQKLKNENGLEYAEDCIIVSNGAKQAAWQAILATCGPGDEVIIPAPYWVSYPEMTVLAGASPKIVPCGMSEGFLLTPEALQKALTPKSRLLILCTPSNPTGATYSKSQLEGLAAVVKMHPRLMVLSDEIYEYITYPPAEHISFASLPGMHEQTLTVNGFSKGFAMTGWRLGYLAAPRFYVQACDSIQSHCTSAASSITQKAGIAALNMGYKGGSEISEMLVAYQDRRDYVIKRLKSVPGVEVVQPDGAFYVFPDVSSFLRKGPQTNGTEPLETTEQLCMHLLQNALVALVPGDAFGAPGYVRLSYATSEQLLEKGLDRLEDALQQLTK